MQSAHSTIATVFVCLEGIKIPPVNMKFCGGNLVLPAAELPASGSKGRCVFAPSQQKSAPLNINVLYSNGV